MSRSPTSNERRDFIFAQVDKLNALKKRKARLYNRKYRRSLFFVSITSVRIFYLLFFAWLYFFKGGTGKLSKEVVLKKDFGIHMKTGGALAMTVYKLDFVTAQGEYKARIEYSPPPALSVGDTVQIQRNWLGQVSTFTKKGWMQTYDFAINWVLYAVVGLFTLVSLTFNDGLERFTDKILLIVWTADLIALFLFFFG